MPVQTVDGSGGPFFLTQLHGFVLFLKKLLLLIKKHVRAKGSPFSGLVLLHAVLVFHLELLI